MFPRTTFILALFAASFIQAQDKLIGGPFVVNVTPRSATVAWVIDTSATSVPVLRSQHITLSNLAPGSRYSYDVTHTDEGKGQFRTPPVGAASFQFIVYGDTRSRHELHKKVAAAMVRAQPDFVLHTGDLVADGSDTAQWPVFFSIEHELLKRTAFYPALGNHERNNRQYYDFFDVTKPYYSFDWGSAHFTVLDSDIGNAGSSGAEREAFWAEQLRWLEDDLTRSQKADLRFVMMHHPPFTAVRARQDGNKLVMAMLPLFEKYNVQAVFGGHDHNYQHHVKNGIHYIVTGGGGAPLYPVDGPIPGITKKVESTEHYVNVKVNGKKARLEAIALDGHLIEGIDIN
jgi:acid phosphatase type 7